MYEVIFIVEIVIIAFTFNFIKKQHKWENKLDDR